jgi:hypothetical protein
MELLDPYAHPMEGGRLTKRKTKGGKLPKEQYELAKQKQADKLRQQQEDPRYDAYFDRLEAQRGQAPVTNQWYMDKSATEKARYHRGLKARQDEYAQATADRIAEDARIAKLQWEEEERRKEHSGFWGTLTDGINTALSAIPGVGTALSTASTLLTEKLRGGRLSGGKVECSCGKKVTTKNIHRHLQTSIHKRNHK